MNPIVEKARAIPIKEKDKKDIDEYSEVALFLCIDGLGGFIWRLNHDMADGRIDESEHPQLDIDIKVMQEEIIYAVSQLPRFGIEVPFCNETFSGSPEYWAWYRKWNKYIKDLSDSEWDILDRKLKNKEDVSSYHPDRIIPEAVSEFTVESKTSDTSPSRTC